MGFVLLSFLFGCSNLIMYFSICLVRFEVIASSGVFLCQFEIGAVDKGLLDLSVYLLFYLSFWCVSIMFEVH